MPYAARLVTDSDTPRAVADVCRSIASQLGGARPDLAFVFASPTHAARFEEIAETLRTELNCRHVLGCSGESIAGGAQEIEQQAALSVWAAVLPNAELESFHVTFERTPDGMTCTGMPELSSDDRPAPQAVFLLGDPFTCAVDSVIGQMELELPGVPLFGGMASGGNGPGDNRLLLQTQALETGGVGVVIRGGPPIRSIVSQGCRPIAAPFVVTKAERNVVFELGGKPALSRLQDIFQTLDERDRELVQRGLHLGVVMNEYQDKFERGDFLITNVVGFDKESGAIAIGNLIRTGQTVQFHVRDADTADEELRLLLERQRTGSPPAQAALLFSCNGRGTRLFAEPHHDASAVQSFCGPIPLAGFFAQGELGPVGAKNYIHGFTASVAFFGD